MGDFAGAISPLSAGTGGESWRRRGPEVFKKAYYKAERDMRDRESRFEEEKRASHSKIHQLRVRLIPYPRSARSFNLPGDASI